ncbi:MAG: GNAT family N-acetyltransferase [Bacteroidota bacterium]
MENPSVQLIEAASKAMAYLGAESAPDAMMSLTLAGDELIIINHTEVQPDFRGKGLGQVLLAFVVDLARERGCEILALCPYARKLFQRNPEFKDVLRGAES